MDSKYNFYLKERGVYKIYVFINIFFFCKIRKDVENISLNILSYKEKNHETKISL